MRITSLYNVYGLRPLAKGILGVSENTVRRDKTQSMLVQTLLPAVIHKRKHKHSKSKAVSCCSSIFIKKSVCM